MTTTWTGQCKSAILLALLTGITVQARAADAPEPLRKTALALNQVTGVEPTNGKILVMLEDTAGSKKLLAVAAVMVKEKQQPFNITATYILAKVAHGLKEVEISEIFYRLNASQALKVQSGRRLSQAYSGLIQLLYDNKKYAESEKVCREFLELDADESVDRYKPLVLRNMILALAKQGQVDKANDMLDRLIKAQPENWLNLELKGRIYREANLLDQAAKTYEEVIDKVKNDKRLSKEDQEEFMGDLRYRLSGVYVDLKQIEKASGHLKALLEKEPDNPTYNNDLGYIWADHDMNLTEAEKLIRKAIEDDRKQRRKANPNLKPEEDKDSAAYLDSLGWVLFKQKKYKEAKEPMLRAVKEEEGQHTEILEHLGDIHMALGEKADAIAVWKKAVDAAGSTKREQLRKTEIEKKIKANE